HNGNQIRCYNCRGLGHFARECTVRLRRRDAAYLQTQLLITQKEEAGIQLQAEEYDLMAAAADLDEIKEVNANCILMANLQQASSSGTQTDSTPVYDLDGSAEISDLNKQLSKEKSTVLFLLEEKKKLKSDFKICEDELLDKQIQLEKKIKDLNNIVLKTGQSIQTIHMLSPKPNSFYHTEQKMALVVSQDIISVVQNASVVDTSDLQIEVERTKERFENCIIKKETEYAKLWNDWYKKCNECKYDKISYDKAYKDMQQKIEQLQAQLGNLKAEETLPKLDEIHALSKPVTSNSVSTPQESKGVNNDKVIAPGMFWISPDKVSREAKKVSNTVSASSGTKPITVSQLNVITKKNV
nr:Gag-Pol polyprotein [Tanacetum cinerariifolium]